MFTCFSKQLVSTTLQVQKSETSFLESLIVKVEMATEESMYTYIHSYHTMKPSPRSIDTSVLIDKRRSD